MSNSGSFAVLPRTDNIQTVLAEYRRQRSNDIINTEGLSRVRAGYNADYVLSGKVERLGDITNFAADILNIEDGSIRAGYDVEYYNFSQESITLMQELAARLSGRMSDTEARKAAEARRRQQTDVADAAAKKEERERFWQDRKDISNHELEYASLYYQFTKKEEVELWGIGYSIAYRFSPLPFTSLGLEGRIGGVGLKFESKFSGSEDIDTLHLGIAPTVGLVFPFIVNNEPIVKLFGNFVADLSYTWYEESRTIYSPYQETKYQFTTGFAPGFEAGLALQWGIYSASGFVLKYRGNWHNTPYTTDGKLYIHRVSIGAFYVFDRW